MPEENFEEQARRKAEEFSMEPNAGVWLRVQAAIKPQRRRRVLLWWWLLPLCMAATVGGFLLKKSGEAPERADTVASRTHIKGKAPLSAEKPAIVRTSKSVRNEKDIADEKERDKDDEGNISGEVEKYGTEKEKDREWLNLPSAGEKDRVIKQEDDSGAEANSRTSDDKIDMTDRKVEQPSFRLKENETALQANSGNRQAPVYADSIGNHEKETPAITFAGKDSALATLNTGKASGQKKKTGRKQWQMGIVTEMGLTSWGKDLLSKEVATNKDYTTVSSASTATIDSLKAATSESQQTKNGIDAGIGFIIRKQTGQHFYFSGHLGYRYQQYQVYNLRTSSGTSLNFTSGYLVNKNNYHGHFISLYAGAGKMLFAGKGNALSVEAGLDNSLLLTTRQQNTKQTALYNANANDAAKATFYRWQPQLSLSLPFSWQAAGKVRFAVMPFARVGLHTYQKNVAGYASNHLMSAGVQAVYFFR